MPDSSSPQGPVQGYVDPNFPNPDGDMDTPIIIYGYTPSFVLALVAASWFLVLFIGHGVQTIRLRCWWFVPFTVGLGFEVAGYIARSLSAKKDPYHLMYYIINYFFIVTAPVIMSAGIYTVISVMITRLGPKYSILAPKTILWFFITSDVVATIAQTTGAALVGRLSAKRADPTPANNTLLAGLAYQVFAMTIFIIIAGSFFARARQAIRESGISIFVVIFSAATLLIYLRTVFRLAEAAQGLWGSLQVNEIYFAFLEFLPVALAAPLLLVWHPGANILREKGSQQRMGKSLP